MRLRGVAALWVVAYHLWILWGGDEFKFGLPSDFSFGLRSLFRAGYQGIDLFFVLSGFVIAWPYVLRGTNRLSLPEAVDFYQRRYLRIAPAYYASIAVAVMLAWLGLLKASTDPWVVMVHLLFAEDFFPETMTAIRGVYWTLPTEIFYYLLFPLLLRWVPLRRPLGWALATAAFAIGYRAFTLWVGDHGVWLTWSSGTLPGRIEQFGLGLVAACAVVNSLSRSRQVSTRVMLGLTLIAILVAIGVGRADGPTPGWTYLFGPTLVAVAIAGMLYGMGVHFAAAPERSPSRIPGARLLYRIGVASLSLYLWHTFFIDVASIAALDWNLALDTRNLLIFDAAQAAIAFSFLSYRWIEEPFIALSKRPGWRCRIMGLRESLISRLGSGHEAAAQFVLAVALGRDHQHLAFLRADRGDGRDRAAVGHEHHVAAAVFLAHQRAHLAHLARLVLEAGIGVCRGMRLLHVSEGEHRRVDTPAHGTRVDALEGDAVRAHRLADRPRVALALLGEVALAAAIVNAHAGRIAHARGGDGVPHEDDLAATAQDLPDPCVLGRIRPRGKVGGDQAGEQQQAKRRHGMIFSPGSTTAKDTTSAGGIAP